MKDNEVMSNYYDIMAVPVGISDGYDNVTTQIGGYEDEIVDTPATITENERLMSEIVDIVLNQNIFCEDTHVEEVFYPTGDKANIAKLEFSSITIRNFKNVSQIDVSNKSKEAILFIIENFDISNPKISNSSEDYINIEFVMKNYTNIKHNLPIVSNIPSNYTIPPKKQGLMDKILDFTWPKKETIG